MKTINNVKSQTKPIEIDDYSSKTTVFVRSNIKESVEIDPIFKTETKVYTYDETQYTYPEWNKLITDGIKEQGAMMQEQVDITQLAMSEILAMISPVLEVSTISTDVLMRRKYSAIVLMYAGMIERHLITIEKVADPYKQDVSLYLEENKE